MVGKPDGTGSEVQYCQADQTSSETHATGLAEVSGRGRDTGGGVGEDIA
jgi:hypothetical protein